MSDLSVVSSKPFWASELHAFVLHCYTGVVNNAEDLLENHKLATQSCFGTRSSTNKTISCLQKENLDPDCDDNNCHSNKVL